MSYEKTIIIETNCYDGSPDNPALAFLRLSTEKLKRLHQALSLPLSQRPNEIILPFQWWPIDSDYEIQGIKVSAGKSGALILSPSSDEVEMQTIGVPGEALHAIRTSSVTHTHHVIGASDLFCELVVRMLGPLNIHFHKGVIETPSSQKRKIAAERIFNLYIYADDDVICELGATVREANGSPEEKLCILQLANKEDLVNARRFPVPSRYSMAAADGIARTGALTHDQFNQLASTGQLLVVFKEVLTALGAPRSPLYCSSPVVNGVLPEMTTVVRTKHVK